MSRRRRRNSDDIEEGNSHPLLGRQTDSLRAALANPLKDFRIILCSGYINVLLIFLPFALMAPLLGWSPTVVFITNFFAMMPLAALLSFATEELSKTVGQGIGGLLNVTFGNATELIVGIIALKAGQVKLIQTAMLGSILSSLLFVLGASFLVGGTQVKEFKFSMMIAQTLSSFMFVATGALILPAAFDAGLPNSTQAGVLALSRGTAIVLLIIYFLFLVYQLKTHPDVFDTESLNQNDESDAVPVEPVSPWITASTILVVTTIVSFCSDFLVGSIDDVVKSLGISKTFIGLIFVPMVGNAAEAVTCFNLGYKIKMDLVVAITLGSCMQIALFLTPLFVILGWIIDIPMTLNFENFQAVVIFVSVMFTEYLIMDGSSNWMEGSMLLGIYSIVAIAYWLYPDIEVKP